MNPRHFFFIAAVSLVFSGCEQENPASDFERRFVLVPIPGFEAVDYATLLDHKDPNVRYLAIANLTASGALGEPSEDVTDEDREFQSNLNGRVRERLQDEAAKVRAIAAHAPSSQSGPDSESGLIALLDDESDAVRVEALAALSNLEEISEAGADAIAVPLGDDHLLVRLHALSAIGNSWPKPKREAIATQLMELLPKRPDLEQLVILQSLDALGTEKAEAAILTYLQSDDPRFSRAALDFVSDMKSDKLEPVLLDLLENEAAPSSAILDLLARKATESSLPIAEKLASSDDPDQRQAGSSILATIRTEEARVILLDAYHQLTPLVEERILGKETDEESRSLIEEHGTLFGHIATLSRALGQLDPDPEAMAKLLASGGSVEKRMAMYWLRQNRLFDRNVLEPDHQGPDFLTGLLALTEDESAILRIDTLETLGHSADPRASEALTAALDSPDDAIRQTAMEASIELAEKTANHNLLKSLHGRREQFTPTSWGEDDPDLAIRLSLEEAVSEIEANWMLDDRLFEDLDPKNSDPTRLIAAVSLGSRGANAENADPVLLDFLADGTAGEKSFLLQLGEEIFDREHLPRLREISAAEQDEALARELEALIEEFGG